MEIKKPVNGKQLPLLDIHAQQAAGSLPPNQGKFLIKGSNYVFKGRLFFHAGGSSGKWRSLNGIFLLLEGRRLQGSHWEMKGGMNQ